MNKEDDTTKSTATCTFKLDESHCPNPKYAGYDYCLEHVEYVTRINVKIITCELIIDELGVDPTEVHENARFIDDLGADSIDILQLILLFQEAFKLEISDQDAQGIQSVRDAVRYLTNASLSVKSYLIHPTLDFPVIRRRIEGNLENVHRVLKKMIEGELFQDYLLHFQLNTQKVEEFLKRVIRNDWIDHITTIPRSGETGSVCKAHIFFLCRTAIYQFTLQPKEIYFQSYALDELKLAYQVKYADEGDISYIKVSRRNENVENDENAKGFTFRTQEGIDEALKFLERFLSNVEKRSDA